MSEKVANVQRKTLKDLQKAWRTIAQHHFKRLQEMNPGFRGLNSSDNSVNTYSTFQNNLGVFILSESLINFRLNVKKGCPF